MLSAAQFVPGSHLWAHSRLPKTEEVVAAELDVGEAFVFLCSVVHAGGANTTEHSRTVHGFFYCRSYLRPEVSCFVFVSLGLDARRESPYCSTQAN